MDPRKRLLFADNDRRAWAYAKKHDKGAIRRITPGVYTSDLDGTIEEIVAREIPAIVAYLYRDDYISHSSALTLKPTSSGTFFIAGAGKPKTFELPGVRVVRSRGIPYPEIVTTLSDGIFAEVIPASTEERIAADSDELRDENTGDGAAEEASLTEAQADYPRIRIATPLQAILECLSTTRQYPEKRLSDDELRAHIRLLSRNEVRRAQQFAARNRLQLAYKRFLKLNGESHEALQPTVVAQSDRKFDLFFYSWMVGTLRILGNGEFRFSYDDNWAIPLSGQLPFRTQSQASYEGPLLPSFFDNFLPEGWTQQQLAASHKIDPADELALLATTRKYLSNLTLRPLGIDESEFTYDVMQTPLAGIAPESTQVVHARDGIRMELDTRETWINMKTAGAVRLSGVQPKLPVSLTVSDGEPLLKLGDLRNSCTHILKLQPKNYTRIVENEWATMELARRSGLRTAETRILDLIGETKFTERRALIVERYDIPTRHALETHAPGLRLSLQEDACSLLDLRRSDKYRTSIEAMAGALVQAGVDRDLSGDGMGDFLRHVVFAYITGNGDLHAKNVSIIRIIRPGWLGEKPVLERVIYSPLYDLVNTMLAIPDDTFALPLFGKNVGFTVQDFTALARRWGASTQAATQIVQHLAATVLDKVDDVLAASQLEPDECEKYRAIVVDRARALSDSVTTAP